jgi:hypothetical protein
MVFDNLAIKDFQPESLCDPNDNAELLKNETLLFTARKDEPLSAASTHEIALLEATLKELRLEVRAEIPIEIGFDRLSAKITFSEDTQTLINLYPNGPGAYVAGLSASIAQRLGKSSSTLVLEAFTNDICIANSNHLLITNLLDVKTGQSVARQRHLREAEQSADQFIAVLRDHINSRDDDALKYFLSYCDIPFVSTARPYFARGLATQWDLNAEMQTLGEKNLKVFDYLHDAALDFFDRHYNRLKRHTKQRDLEGIANFLHLFRATGEVLRSQSARLFAGLDAKQTPLAADEWAKCRGHFDTYYTRFRQLIDCLWAEYTSAMIREHVLQAVQERFDPDIEAIHSLCKDMLGFRDRIEKLRVSRLRISGRMEPPAYFHCIFNESQWPRFANNINTQLANVETAVRGQALI